MPFNIYLLGDLGSCFQRPPHPVLWSVVLLDKKVEFDTIKKKLLAGIQPNVRAILTAEVTHVFSSMALVGQIKLVSPLAAKQGTNFTLLRKFNGRIRTCPNGG